MGGGKILFLEEQKGGPQTDRIAVYWSLPAYMLVSLKMQQLWKYRTITILWSMYNRSSSFGAMLSSILVIVSHTIMLVSSLCDIFFQTLSYTCCIGLRLSQMHRMTFCFVLLPCHTAQLSKMNLYCFGSLDILHNIWNSTQFWKQQAGA